MNQILATGKNDDNNRNINDINNVEQKVRRNNQPANTRSVIKVFAIILCIFAIILVAVGGYAIYKNMSSTPKEVVKPEISIENKTENSIIVKVTSKTGINTVSFGWNDEEKTVIQGNGKKYAEQIIDIPSGSNVLNIIAEDINGETIESKKTYELDSNIVIGNDDTDGTIIISYEGEKQISYMTYKWDEEEEAQLEINNTSFEEKIDAIKGIHTLTVTVVDIDGNKETKTQKIKGTSKPTVSIEVDETNTYFIIKATDDTALQNIDLMINDDPNQEYRIKTTEKEFEYKIRLALGANKLRVIANNSDNMSTEVTKEYNKEE